MLPENIAAAMYWKNFRKMLFCLRTVTLLYKHFQSHAKNGDFVIVSQSSFKTNAAENCVVLFCCFNKRSNLNSSVSTLIWIWY